MVISCKVRKLSPIRGLSRVPTHERGQNLFTVPAPDDQNLHLSVSIQSLFAFKKYPVIWNIAHSSIKLPGSHSRWDRTLTYHIQICCSASFLSTRWLILWCTIFPRAPWRAGMSLWSVLHSCPKKAGSVTQLLSVTVHHHWLPWSFLHRNIWTLTDGHGKTLNILGVCKQQSLETSTQHWATLEPSAVLWNSSHRGKESIPLKRRVADVLWNVKF